MLCFQTDSCTASRYYTSSKICEFGLRSVPTDATRLTPSGSIANIFIKDGTINIIFVLLV